ncbi:hypothetical protein ACFV7R_10915 [Streptomyces sp. NPDC059866]|uniref:hypothetical protein n=1 Tax=Streptomyces sp. NPDC059866 TaxID=3346978 RepID=UPI003648B75D
MLNRVRVLFAADGRRSISAPLPQARSSRRPPEPVDPAFPCPGSPRPIPAPTVRRWYTSLDGAESRLVRPYLTAHEREEKARLQRLRRDILWCATYGVDLDARDIHAVLGAAS